MDKLSRDAIKALIAENVAKFTFLTPDYYTQEKLSLK